MHVIEQLSNKNSQASNVPLFTRQKIIIIKAAVISGFALACLIMSGCLSHHI